MNKFKSALFYTTFLFLVILYVVLGAIAGICEFFVESMHKYEGWCFNYKKSGLVYRGDGIWSHAMNGETNSLGPK